MMPDGRLDQISSGAFGQLMKEGFFYQGDFFENAIRE
jgi:hypothetical protein